MRDVKICGLRHPADWSCKLIGSLVLLLDLKWLICED